MSYDHSRTIEIDHHHRHRFDSMGIDSKKLLHPTSIHNVSGRSVIAIKFVPNTQNRLQAPFPDAPQPRRPSHLPSENASWRQAHHSHGNPQKFTPQVVVTPKTFKTPPKNHENCSYHHHGTFFFVCGSPPRLDGTPRGAPLTLKPARLLPAQFTCPTNPPRSLHHKPVVAYNPWRAAFSPHPQLTHRRQPKHFC